MSTQSVMAFPPGDFLAEELEARGWTQADFAEIIGRPAQLVSGIVSGKKEITRETACEIGTALGTSAEVWLNLQNAYELWLRESDPSAASKLADVRTRAKMNQRAPISVLRKRGFLPSGPLVQQRDALLRLLGIETLDDEPAFAAAARRHNSGQPITSTQCAWLACARAVSRDLRVASYDRDALLKLAAGLTQDVRSPEDLATLPERFAAAGVRLVHVEAFPGSRLSGASFSEGDGGPVIALSSYGKRLDRVVFTLLHEIAHVVLGHVVGGRIVVDEGVDASDPQEGEADELAGRWALPHVMDPPANVRRPWVYAEADRQGVHPMIIVGRLQHEGRLDWKTELARGAPTVDAVLARW